MRVLPSQLVKALKEDRVVLFFGAGVSVACGLPGSGDLAEMLRNELLADVENDRAKATRAEEVRRATSLTRVAQLHQDYYQSKRARQKIAETLQRAERAARVDVLAPLKELPCIRMLLTTNYDTLAETILAPEDYYLVLRDGDMRQLMAERLQIVKLHGTVHDRDSMVLTDEDYRTFRTTHAPIVDLVKTVIRTKTLVVLGYSLEDTNFGEIYAEAIGPDANVLNYFVSPEASLYQQLHWTKRGFEHIPMDAGEFLRLIAETYAQERYVPERASFAEKPVAPAGVDPLNNPFTLFDTEALIDTRPQFLFKTFVHPVEFPTILEHQHTFIEGHRGSGKSTILWRMSILARQFDGVDLPMWGFYVKMVPGLFFAFRRARRPDGSWADDDATWTAQFTHYFNLIVLNGILLNLENAIKANVVHPVDNLADIFSELLGGLMRVDANGCRSLVQCRRRVERAVDTARSRRQLIDYYTGPTFISQALEVLSDGVPELATKWWHILLDEYDNVYAEQQAVVNVLLRERHPRLRFKIAVKTLHAYLKDIDGKTLDPTDDFGFVACDSFIWDKSTKARYVDFLRELSQQRLLQAGFPNLGIQELLPPGSHDEHIEPYAGFEAYAVLSSGLTRLYLELCKDAIYEAFPDAALRRIELRPVPPRIQMHVARVHAAILFKSYASAREPDMVLRLFKVLGPLFRGIAAVTAEQDEYRSPLSFELSDLDQLSERSLQVLEDAVKARLLQLPVLPKQPRNPIRETPAQKYSFHRLLCPFFKLSTNERYPVKIDGSTFNQIWSDPDVVRDQLAQGYRQKGISRHIDDLLPLFRT